MLASRWLVLLVYPHTVGGTECLVGCLVQGIDPFDDENLAVWEDRGACDSSTVGCEVTSVTIRSTSYQGALWVSTSGSDGSTSCTCAICDPYPWSDTTSYMKDETSLWSRIHCYLAASEASGYDVSPCVAAILDTGTLPCVDDVYEAPTMDQFECEENGIMDLTDFVSYNECDWDGELREVQELFLATSAVTSSTSSSSLVNTNSCLVGCLVQGVSPFDEDGLAVWDNRGTCDSETIGCEVSALNSPSTSSQGALWASSWGNEGSDSCTCKICDPFSWDDTTNYMDDETSLWSRIQCYLVASEASGYDVSLCVAAIVDTGTLPCVNDAYEAPGVDQFECAENGIMDLTDSVSYEECNWTGTSRLTRELYSGTRAPSPLPAPTAAPAPSTTRIFTPQPDAPDTASPDATTTVPSTTSLPSTDGPKPSITSTISSTSIPTTPSETSQPSPRDTPTAPSETPPPSASNTRTVPSRTSPPSPIDSPTAPSETPPPSASNTWTVSSRTSPPSPIGLPTAPSETPPPIASNTRTLPSHTFPPSSRDTPTAPSETPPPSASNTRTVPSHTFPPSSRDTPTAPSETPPPSASNTRTVPSRTSPPSPIDSPTAPSETPPPSASNTRAVPSRTSPPSSSDSTLLLESEAGAVCGIGSTCADNLCCHPDTTTCGRKYTYCQKRDFVNGPRCCSGVNGDSSSSNVCLEDTICDEPDSLTQAEVAGIWIGIITGLIVIVVSIWQLYQWCEGRRCDIFHKCR